MHTQGDSIDVNVLSRVLGRTRCAVGHGGDWRAFPREFAVCST